MIIDILVIIATETEVRSGHFCLQVEAELSELATEERQEYLKSLGVDESGLGNLIRATYDLLGLRTYFTSGEKVRGNLENFERALRLLNTCIV
jgi:obg-like ATPase 1